MTNDATLNVPSAPPFDPPYITALETGLGTRWVETRADGTVRDIVRAPRPAPGSAPSPAAPSKSTAPRRSGQAAGRTASAGKSAMVLDVPFSEKDDAKRLGARWDSVQRKWYVPQGLDIKLFSRWSDQS
ncbi:DUF5710 domain-containing protein [Lacisediminimonas profundi]|uniref:DUF5710 domain-containing protein n=1 Tax=Lacisediminimonas profundi TaxID=2603856 RepID=UPI00124AFD5E|nr:DUF5710 domain-containing protein [Lacisediminimonas profundi]